MFAHIEAVLVDIDGTLLDSNHAHTAAWVAAFSTAGRPIPYDVVRPLIGKGGDKLLAEAAGIDDGSQAGERLADVRKRVFERDHLPALQATPGARDLLVHLRARGIRIVVATSAGGSEVDALLGQAGIEDLVDAVATSTDAAATKPDPDIVHAALDKAGVSPGHALMIGDTPHDVAAATRAGVPCVALRCGGFWTDDRLAGAIAVFDDPAALLRAWRTDECPADDRGASVLAAQA